MKRLTERKGEYAREEERIATTVARRGYRDEDQWERRESHKHMQTTGENSDDIITKG